MSSLFVSVILFDFQNSVSENEQVCRISRYTRIMVSKNEQVCRKIAYARMPTSENEQVCRKIAYARMPTSENEQVCRISRCTRNYTLNIIRRTPNYHSLLIISHHMVSLFTSADDCEFSVQFVSCGHHMVYILLAFAVDVDGAVVDIFSCLSAGR